MSREALGRDAHEICQTLLRIDTTNPPGHERPAAEYLEAKLEEAGLDTTLLESLTGRANLVCRYRGTGARPPLLLTAHLDVVEADGARWRYPPFSGAEAEGFLWGRGALDMKHMAAMCVAVMRRLAREQVRLARDVIFAAVADEEAGCEHGSRFLVEKHPDLVRAEYAIGEAGGFSLHVGRSTLYPIQVAEKGFCWIRARARSEPGHGSLPRDDSAVIKLGEAIAKLGRTLLPVHPTPYVRDFLATLVDRQPALARPLLRALAHPRLLPRALRLLPDRSVARGLTAVCSNTAAPTVLRAGAKTNVIPAIAEVEIDGRTLPGQTDEDLLRELRAILGPGIELDVIASGPPVETQPVESPLYRVIKAHVESREADATVVPYLTPGSTDAKHFTRLGARWYGFAPVKAARESGLRFGEMVHGHNERIPVASLYWGADLLYDVVAEFCAA